MFINGQSKFIVVDEHTVAANYVDVAPNIINCWYEGGTRFC